MNRLLIDKCSINSKKTQTQSALLKELFEFTLFANTC